MEILFCIETLECGVWDVWDTAETLEEALMLTSSLCETISEERIRIHTPDFEVI